MPFSIHLHKKVISALEIEPAAFHLSVNVLVSEMVRHVPFVLVEMSVGILVFPDSTTIAKMRTTKRSLCHWMNVRSLQIATMSGHVDALQLFQNVPYAKMDPALPWTFPRTLPESVIPVPLTFSWIFLTHPTITSSCDAKIFWFASAIFLKTSYYSIN